MLKPISLLIGRTCSLRTENAEVGTWLFRTGVEFGQQMAQMRADRACTYIDIRSRIHHSRNAIVKIALRNNFDYLCFVDADMDPDFRLHNPLLPDSEQPHARSWAKPFLSSSLAFMQQNHCGVVAAPAVSGPPQNKLNFFVVDWESEKDPATGLPTQWRRCRREEYQSLEPQFKPVCGIGTGLMLIDMNVFRKVSEPWFDDIENEDKTDTEQSQDINFCRKVNAAGIPVYANLFAPARHIKFDGQDPHDYIGPQSWTTPAPTTLSKLPSPTPRPIATPSLLPAMPSHR